MEKSTKKVLVVAGVTITLGTGGYIGYKVIKNKRNRAEQARCFNADNDILHSLNEIKDEIKQTVKEEVSDLKIPKDHPSYQMQIVIVNSERH